MIKRIRDTLQNKQMTTEELNLLVLNLAEKIEDLECKYNELFQDKKQREKVDFGDSEISSGTKAKSEKMLYKIF